MGKPSIYWDKRAARRLMDAEKQSEAYIKRINKMYDQAERNIQREIDAIYRNYSKATGMDVQSLKTLLSKTETAKLWDELKRKGLDKYVKGNYKARITRLERLQAQIYAKAKEVYPKEQNAHTGLYKGVMGDTYYKSIYDAQMGTGYDFAFNRLDDNLVNRLLNEPWSGANYSKRIWGNTDLLAESLSEIVGGALLSGQSIAKTSRQIRERFDVAKYYADRLVRTETNHFHNEADAMAYEEMDVDKYVFLAVLDTRTSTICQGLDNRAFPLKDRAVGVNYPPMHPNCRSTTRAYMGEEVERTLQRRARDPITGKNEVIGNMSYGEWAELHDIGKDSAEINFKNRGKGLKNQGRADILKDKPTAEQARAIKKEQKRAKQYARRVSFDGVTNPQNAKTVNDTLEHLTEAYPTKKLSRIVVDDLGKHNASGNYMRLRIDRAYVNGNKKATNWAEHIERNKAKISNLRSQWLGSSWERRAEIDDIIADLNRDNKFTRWSVSSGGYGVRGTITHEYGHVLADQHIGLTNGNIAITSYDVGNEARYKQARETVKAAYDRAVKTGDIFNISKYAENNEREFFAETFAMYDFGEQLPKYITDMLTEVLNV